MQVWAAPHGALCFWCADGQDAHTLYEQETSRRKIVTLCRDLDEALGGGVSLGRIVEFCECDVAPATWVPPAQIGAAS